MHTQHNISDKDQMQAVVNSAQQIEELKTELYAIGDAGLMQDLDNASGRLSAILVENPGMAGYAKGGEAGDEADEDEEEDEEEYAKGGVLNERFSLKQLIFGKGRKYKLGGKTPGANLFKKAAAKASPAAKKERNQETVVLTEKRYPGISNTIELMTKLREEIEEKKAELEVVQGEVLEVAKEQYVELYSASGRNPNTFVIEGENGGCMMVIPQDRYISIDESRAADVSKQFSPSIVDSKTVYTFNSEVLAKYETVISDLINNSPKISQEDKDRLIEGKTTYTIKKGSIDELYNLFKANLKKAFEAINPVFQLKNCK